MSGNREVDHVTGVETTGHTWDGDLKELNKPLPRWWLYTFYVTIVWAFGYWIFYPAWPTINSYTKGVLAYSQRAAVSADVVNAVAAQKQYRDALVATPLDKIAGNDDLMRFAYASGKAAFQSNCAPCHGRGAQGAEGYPNLNDDEWLWGGSIAAIHQTITQGVRQPASDARATMMPRFGLDSILEAAQISDAAEYVMSLSGVPLDAEQAKRGKAVFAEQCANCHQADGQGNPEIGAPDLTNAIWLYGADRASIIESIRTGRGGKMPSWSGRLDEPTIRALAVYVHGLGGGQ